MLFVCWTARNGLLFTGDTYYPAPIWLFRPETDLDAYVASVQRIAGHCARFETGAGRAQYPCCAAIRGFRDWSPAIQAVRAGKGESKPEGADKVIFVDRRIFISFAGAERFEAKIKIPARGQEFLMRLLLLAIRCVAALLMVCTTAAFAGDKSVWNYEGRPIRYHQRSDSPRTVFSVGWTRDVRRFLRSTEAN